LFRLLESADPEAWCFTLRAAGLQGIDSSVEAFEPRRQAGSVEVDLGSLQCIEVGLGPLGGHVSDHGRCLDHLGGFAKRLAQPDLGQRATGVTAELEASECPLRLVEVVLGIASSAAKGRASRRARSWIARHASTRSSAVGSGAWR
jgi:hypothetical protein